MFLGEFEHSLDSKGRLVLPRKFRDELEAGLFRRRDDKRLLQIAMTAVGELI